MADKSMDAWLVQVSIKTTGQTLINVRAMTVEDLKERLEGFRRSLTPSLPPRQWWACSSLSVPTVPRQQPSPRRSGPSPGWCYACGSYCASTGV